MESARCPYPECRFVFLAEGGEADCPSCRRRVRVRRVRHEGPWEARRREAGTREVPDVGPGDVCVLLDDVRSLWNVGSVLRTADGLGLRHVFLCGITGLPTDPRVAKSALGAERTVSWSYHVHPFEVLDRMRVVVVERAPGGVALEAAVSATPLCLVVGNEVDGVSPEVLSRADEIVELPALGVKNSLNVAVACGIAGWWFRCGRPARASLPPGG